MNFDLFKEFFIPLIKYTPTSLFFSIVILNYSRCLYKIPCVILGEQKATSVHQRCSCPSIDKFLDTFGDNRSLWDRLCSDCTIQFVFLLESVELSIFKPIIGFAFVPYTNPWSLFFESFFKLFQCFKFFDLFLYQWSQLFIDRSLILIYWHVDAIFGHNRVKGVPLFLICLLNHHMSISLSHICRK